MPKMSKRPFRSSTNLPERVQPSRAAKSLNKYSQGHKGIDKWIGKQQSSSCEPVKNENKLLSAANVPVKEEIRVPTSTQIQDKNEMGPSVEIPAKKVILGLPSMEKPVTEEIWGLPPANIPTKRKCKTLPSEDTPVKVGNMVLPTEDLSLDMWRKEYTKNWVQSVCSVDNTSEPSLASAAAAGPSSSTTTTIMYCHIETPQMISGVRKKKLATPTEVKFKTDLSSELAADPCFRLSFTAKSLGWSSDSSWDRLVATHPLFQMPKEYEKNNKDKKTDPGSSSKI